MTTFNKSVDVELKQHVFDIISNYSDISSICLYDLHNECFNQDYYIIGYYQASEWLKEHNIDTFDAIAYVVEKQQEHFGDSITADDINSERVVNLLVYFYSLECIDFYALESCDNIDDITELLEID